MKYWSKKDADKSKTPHQQNYLRQELDENGAEENADRHGTCGCQSDKPLLVAYGKKCGYNSKKNTIQEAAMTAIHFSFNLQKYRKAHNLSQEDLAEKLQVSPPGRGKMGKGSKLSGYPQSYIAC